MRKKGRSLKRVLALLLAVVLTVTYVPTDGLVVRASEVNGENAVDETEPAEKPDAQSEEQAPENLDEATPESNDEVVVPEDTGSDVEKPAAEASGDPTGTGEGTPEEVKKEETDGTVSDGKENEAEGTESNPSVDDTENTAGGSGTNNEDEAASNGGDDTPAGTIDGSGDVDTPPEEPESVESFDVEQTLLEAPAESKTVTVKVTVDKSYLPNGVADVIVGPATVNSNTERLHFISFTKDAKHLSDFETGNQTFTITDNDTIYAAVKWKNPGITGQVNFGGAAWNGTASNEFAYFEEVEWLNDVYKLETVEDGATTNISVIAKKDANPDYAHRITFHKPEGTLQYKAEFKDPANPNSNNIHTTSNGESVPFVYDSETDESVDGVVFNRFVHDEDTYYIKQDSNKFIYYAGNNEETGEEIWNDVTEKTMYLKVTTSGVDPEEDGEWVVRKKAENGTLETLEKDETTGLWKIILSGLGTSETGKCDLDISWKTAKVTVTSTDSNIAKDDDNKTPLISISGEALNGGEAPTWNEGLNIDALVGKELTVTATAATGFKPKWKTGGTEFTLEDGATNSWSCTLIVPEDGFTGEIATEKHEIEANTIQFKKPVVDAGAKGSAAKKDYKVTIQKDSLTREVPWIWSSKGAEADGEFLIATEECGADKTLDVVIEPETADASKTWKVVGVKVNNEPLDANADEADTWTLDLNSFSAKLMTVEVDVQEVSTLTIDTQDAQVETVKVEAASGAQPDTKVIKNQNGTYTVSSGEPLTLTATAKDGYKIGKVSIAGGDTIPEKDGSYPISGLTGDTTVNVETTCDPTKSVEVEFVKDEGYNITEIEGDTSISWPTEGNYSYWIEKDAIADTVKAGKLTVKLEAASNDYILPEQAEYQLGETKTEVDIQKKEAEGATPAYNYIEILTTTIKAGDKIVVTVKPMKKQNLGLTVVGDTANTVETSAKLYLSPKAEHPSEIAKEADDSWIVYNEKDYVLEFDLSAGKELVSVVKTFTGENAEEVKEDLTFEPPVSGTTYSVSAKGTKGFGDNTEIEITVRPAVADYKFTFKEDAGNDKSTETFTAEVDTIVYTSGKNNEIRIAEADKTAYDKTMEIVAAKGYRLISVQIGEEQAITTGFETISLKGDMFEGSVKSLDIVVKTEKVEDLSITVKNEYNTAIDKVEGVLNKVVTEETAKKLEAIAGTDAGNDKTNYVVARTDDLYYTYTLTGTNKDKYKLVLYKVETDDEGEEKRTEVGGVKGTAVPGGTETSFAYHIGSIDKTAEYEAVVEIDEMKAYNIAFTGTKDDKANYYKVLWNDGNGGDVDYTGKTYRELDVTKAKAGIEFTIEPVAKAAAEEGGDPIPYAIAKVTCEEEDVEITRAGNVYTVKFPATVTEGKTITVNVTTDEAYELTIPTVSNATIKLEKEEGTAGKKEVITPAVDKYTVTKSDNLILTVTTDAGYILKPDSQVKLTKGTGEDATESNLSMNKEVGTEEGFKSATYVYGEADGESALDKLSQNAKIEMATTLDEAQVYGLKFEGDHYTVTINGDDNGGNGYSKNDPYLTKAELPDSVTAIVTPEDGYEITETKLDDSDALEGTLNKATGAITYTLSFKDKEQTVGTQSVLNVVANLKKVVTYQALNIKLADDVKYEKVNYEVKAKDGVEKSTAPAMTGYEQRYLVRKGVDSVELTITMPDNKSVPVVKLNGQALGETEVVQNEGTSTWDCLIKGDYLKSGDNTVEISVPEFVTKEVTFKKADGLRKVKLAYEAVWTESTGWHDGVLLKPGDTYTEEEDLAASGKVEIRYGKKVTLTIETDEDRFDLKKLTKKVKGQEAEEISVSGAKASYEFELTENVSFEAETEGKEFISSLLYKEQEMETTGGADTYLVEAGETYTMNFAKGNGNVDLVNPVVEGTEKATKATVSGGKLTIKVGKADAGKTLKVTVSKKTGEKQKNPDTGKEEDVIAVAKTFTLVVRANLSSIVVSGVDAKTGVILQRADSVGRYGVTAKDANESTAKLDGLKASSDNKNITAVIDPENPGVLVVTTKATAAKDEEATISFTNGSTKLDTTVKVRVAAPAAVESGKVKAVAKTTSDKDLYIQVTLPKDIVMPNEGGLYYKAEIEKIDGAEPAKAVQYFAVETFEDNNGTVHLKDTQVLTVAIAKGKVGDAKREEAVGKYNVNISLVQTSKAEAEDKVTDKIEMYSSAAVTVKNMETKASYYETGFKLKKASGQIYTGQDNATLATINYSKLTSHVEEWVVENERALGELGINDARVEGGAVIANIGKNCKPGTYTITVRAKKADNKDANGKEIEGYDTYAPSASITITIVRGITSLAITGVPSEITKTKGALKLKAGVIYNGDATGTNKEKQPKTKKVTWSLEDVSAGLLGKVVMKNGAITIDKNYVPNDGDSFTIVAKAADYAANTETAPKTVTIRTAAREAATISIVGTVNEKDVVYGEGSTIPADQVEDLYVVLKDANGESANELYSLKASNKSLGIMPNGKLTLSGFKKEIKNITITATPLNGSKQKKTLGKISIGYAQFKGTPYLEMRVNGYSNKPSETGLSYYGSPATVISLQAAYADGDSTGYLSAKNNVQITAKKGAKAVQKMDEDGYMTVVLTKESGIVELSVNGSKTLYTLTNAGFNKNKAPKVQPLSDRNGNTTGYKVVLGKGQTASPYVMVEAIPADYQRSKDKKDGKYTAFAKALGINPTGINLENVRKVLPVTDGKITFVNSFDGVPKGSYKLQMTFGKYENGEFVAESKSLTAAWKIKGATAPKTVTCTLSLQDKGVAEFEYGTLEELLNANLTGQSNHFLDFFDKIAVDNKTGAILTKKEIEKAEEGSYHYCIGIKSGADLSKAEQNDYTGYVQYDGEQFVMVKVVVKDGIIGKYALSQPSILLGRESVAAVSVTEGKNPVSLKKAEVTDNGGLDIKKVAVEGNKILLTVDASKLTDAKSYKLALNFATMQGDGTMIAQNTNLKTVQEEKAKNSLLFSDTLEMKYDTKTKTYKGTVGYDQAVYSGKADKVTAAGLTGTAENGLLSLELTKDNYATTKAAIKEGKLDIALSFGKSEAKGSVAVWLDEEPQTLQNVADELKTMRDNGSLLKFFGGIIGENKSEIEKRIKDNLLTKTCEVTVSAEFKTRPDRDRYLEITLKEGKESIMVATKDLNFAIEAPSSNEGDKAQQYLDEVVNTLRAYLQVRENGELKNLWKGTVTEADIKAKALELCPIPAEYKLVAETSDEDLAELVATDQEDGLYTSTWKLSREGYEPVENSIFRLKVMEQLADLDQAKKELKKMESSYHLTKEDSEDTISAKAKELVDALGNKDITMKVVEGSYQEETPAGSKTEVSITFLLENPKTQGTSISDEVQEVTLEFENVSKYAYNEGTALKTAVESFLNDGDNEEWIKDEFYAAAYDGGTVKDSVIAKIKADVLGISDWEIEGEAAVEEPVEADEETPTDKDGKITLNLTLSYTGEVPAKPDGSAGDPVDNVTVSKEINNIKPSLKVKPIAEIRTMVEEKLKEELAKIVDKDVKEADLKTKVTGWINSLLKGEITPTLEAFVVNDYSLEKKDLNCLKQPAAKEAGSVALNLVFGDNRGETQPQIYELGMWKQTMADAKSEITAALKTLNNKAGLSTSEIETAIGNVLNDDIKTELTGSSDKEEEINVTEPTETKAGLIKGRVKITITEGEGENEKETTDYVSVNLTIPKTGTAK